MPTDAEIEQFARYSQSLDEARGWPPKGSAFYRSRAQFHFGNGGAMPAGALPFAIKQPEPLKASPRPAPAPVTAVQPRPAALPVSAAVVADRARAATLIRMTAKGAEAESECREAIRAGITPEDYEATVAARMILDAVKALRGDRS